MKRCIINANGNGRSIQENTAAPSRNALKSLTIEFLELDTNRERVGKSVGINSDVIRWAFLTGTSSRAAEVRRIVNAHLARLRRKQKRMVAA